MKSSARILRNVRTAILKIAVRPLVMGWAAGMNEFSIKDIVAHSAKRRTYETKLSQCGARCRIEISGPSKNMIASFETLPMEYLENFILGNILGARVS